MSPSIAAPINKAAHIRILRDTGLDVYDIRDLTGYSLPEIKAAFRRKEKDRPKSRVLAGGALRGPLTADALSAKLQVPLSHARRVTGG